MVKDTHQECQTRAPDWRKLRLFFAGARAVKAAGTLLLPRLPGQQQSGTLQVGPEQDTAYFSGTVVDEYLSYKMRAKPLCAYAGRVLRGMVGMSFRKPPVFEVPDAIKPHLDNLTLTGTTGIGLAKEALRQNLAVSFGALLVDYSESSRRPYVRLYCAENVLDWDEVVIDGKRILTRVVLREFAKERDEKGVAEHVEQRREVMLTAMADADPVAYPLGVLTHQLWREERDSNGKPTGEWITFGPPMYPVRRAAPVPFVPVVLFNADGIEARVTDPVLLELIELIHGHYMLSADLGQLLHLVGAGTFLHGSGITEGEKKETFRVGGGALVLSSNPQAVFKYVQTAGTDAKVITEEMEALKREMAVAVARLLLSEERRVAETAESQQVAFAADDASLQGVVGATSAAMQQAMRFYVWWESTAATPEEVEGVTVTLNTDFIAQRMSAEELVAFGAEVLAGRLSFSSYFWLAQQGELHPAGRTEEEERALIEADRKKREAEAASAAENQPGPDDADKDEMPMNARAKRNPPDMMDAEDE